MQQSAGRPSSVDYVQAEGSTSKQRNNAKTGGESSAYNTSANSLTEGSSKSNIASSESKAVLDEILALFTKWYAK